MGNSFVGVTEEIRPMMDSATTEEYVLGNGDKLEITVYRHPELTKEVTVRPDGMITYPMVGNLVANGRTASDLSADIKEKLTVYLRSPEVTVVVMEFNSRKVLVLGEVTSPGSFKIEAGDRLLDILTQAGWMVQEQGHNTVNIMREDGSVIRADMDALLYQTDTSQNILLNKNDTIFVPRSITSEEEASSKVTAYGEVSTPGIYDYPLDGKLTVKDVLLMSGGVTENSAQNRGRIIRANGDVQVVNLQALIYDGDISQDYIMNPGDSLFVPRKQEVEVYVLGMVSSPGLYVISERPNVLQALALAEYYRFGAVLRSTKVVRGDPNNPLVISVDLERLLFKGDRTQNIRMETGDVLFIPQSFISSVGDFIRNVWPMMATSLDAYSRVRTVDNGGSMYYDPSGRYY